MEKVVVPERVLVNSKFEYNGVEIEVIPYISWDTEINIINDYVNLYFHPLNVEEPFQYLKQENFDYWRAEAALIQRIIRDMTNIDTVNTNKNELDDIFSIIVNSNFIDNYKDFRSRLDGTVESIKDSKSIGIVIDGLVTKIQDILSSFQNIDPEQLKELADSLIGKMENSSVSEIFTEATKQSKPNKTRKTKEIKA